MTTTVEIFVGSNNRTHQVERDALETILAAHVDGYTLTDARGMWQGTTEDSVSVLTTVPRARRMALLRALRAGLGQDAVAWRKVPPLRFVSAA